MNPRTAFLTLGLTATLAACAPQTSGSTGPEPTLLVAGGVVEGRWVRLGNLQFSLPAVPTLAAAEGNLFYAAYPFQLLVYENGNLRDSIPTPGTPVFLRTRPRVVLGGEFGLFTPEGGRFPYKARDALNTGNALFWVDGNALHAGGRRLLEGPFTRIIGDEGYWVALGRREAYRWPEDVRFPLPAEPLAVALADDLYILTSAGIYQLSRSGLQINFRPGAFSALTADAQWVYALRDGQLVRFTSNLGVQ